MTETTTQEGAPIAIVGMGCMFPGAPDLNRYWSNILEGEDAIGEVPETHWDAAALYDPDPSAPDKTYGRRGGFLETVGFDPLAWGIAPRDIEATDTTQLLGMMVARQALEDAGYGPGGRDFDRERVSVILGVTGALELVIPLGARLGHPIWRRALEQAGVDPETTEDVVARIGDGYPSWQENSFPGLLGNVAAGRIANRLDLHGTNCVVDAACASSLSAVHMAMMELRAGQADMVLSGGVDTFNDIFMFTCFSKTPALSKRGDVRPFDDDGDGTILGEGLGVVVLKRLEDAERDGDRIHAVIRGMGSSSDGKGDAVYAPSADGQARAMRRAYEAAGIDPGTVELVEAHGTGTRVGDATECRSLTTVYREAREEVTWCALGSVKSMIGHTKAAAGSAGLIKTALALRHGVLPPTIKVERPNAAVSPNTTPFYVNTVARPWVALGEQPRRAAVSAFGFGGSNFHCVLEEYRGPAPSAPRLDQDGRFLLFALSAPSRGALTRNLADLTSNVAKGAPAQRRALAAASCAGFDAADAHRLVVPCERGAEAEALEAAARLLGRGDGPWTSPQGASYGVGPAQGTLAALFPGQGAQYVGMLRDLACRSPRMQEALAEADTVHRDALGGRLTDRVYPHPAFSDDARERQDAALRATEVTQPALGAVSLGALRLLERFAVEPAAALGHSYGELVALCAAGRLSAEELHRLSRLRGELMAAGDGDRGSMLAVSHPLDEVEALLSELDLDLVLANKNTPRQAVLSGATAEIERAEALLSERGLRVVRLNVAAAFHSPLVASASEPFANALAEVALAPGRFPVWANTTAQPYPDDASAARDLLANQLASPVEFVRAVEAMYAAGARTFLEIGPGRRLGGLVRTILADRDDVTLLSMDASSGRQHGLLDLARALAGLAAAGHPVALDRWDPDAPPLEEATKRPRLLIPINGANVFKAPAPRPPRKPTPPVKAPTPRRPSASPSRASAPNGADSNGAAVALKGEATPAPPAPRPASAPAPSVSAAPRPNGATNGVHAAAYGDRNGVSGAATWSAAHASPAATPLKHRAAPPAPPTPREVTMSDDHANNPWLTQALQSTSASLEALMQMQAQTATLHHQFLVGQERATESFQALIERQQQMFTALLDPAAATPSAPAPIHAPPTAPAPPHQHHHLAWPPSPAANGATNGVHGAPTFSAPTAAPPAPIYRNGEVPNGVSTRGAEPVTRAPTPPAPKQAPQPARPAAPQPAPPQAPGGLGKGRVSEVLLGLVSEKTGYPVEMLELSMGLDSDLGIDSIKRVEILSALEEQLPEAPAIKPEHLGELQTLGHIVGFLADPSAASGQPEPVAQAEAAPSP
ncbi:MAG: hypothetical protein CMH57_01100, partial [Myxococcales bacterium]|nr:hypothetical protein [Myxococcales bacterium]